jgi:CRP/FNR family nitrogen fixation transcriptional regulator
LVKLAERQRPRNGSLTVRLAIQRDIADYLGLTVETVSRQLTMLKDKGIVKRHDRRTLEILDMEALIDLSGEPDPLSHHFEHGISVAR